MHMNWHKPREDEMLLLSSKIHILNPKIKSIYQNLLRGKGCLVSVGFGLAFYTSPRARINP